MKRTGSVFSRGKGKNKTWWARFIYVGDAGVRHDLRRKGQSKSHARDLADDLAAQYAHSIPRYLRTLLVNLPVLLLDHLAAGLD